MDRLVLHAPFNGILESDTAELGSLLQAGSLCATVIQLDTIKLVGYVPETSINHVSLGSKAGARLATGKQVAGTVSFISRSADETTRTFEVEITVANPDLAIRDGQTAEIVIAAEGTKAHRLPQSALTLNNEGQLGVRVVREDKTAGFVPVTLLRDESTGVWIDGLPEEADVITVDRARMVLAFIAISLLVGGFAYVSLPKEGEPDIEIPALFISVPFPGISAEDSETLLVKVMETELADLDGLDKMSATAAEGYAGVALEFDFGWDKTAVMADVRDAMDAAEAEFPEGAEKYAIHEINFSEFPIVIVNMSGPVPERTMARLAKDLQDDLEALDSVLEAGIAGNRDEMVEVLIDPLRLESYNVTAVELINVVQNNNQLIAAGEVESNQGTFSVKIPSSFDSVEDIYGLPVKTNGDRVVTLGELAQINFTFEDRQGTARFDGRDTVALQVVKRKGFNLIDTVDQVKATLAEAQDKWPPELKAAVTLGTSNDQSRVVGSMVSQLEGSVLTAVALVMIVILAALGSRAALLVGFAIPTSFLLCFAFLALMGISVSNIVMFGLILAVGMLVDGAIVVVEYADKRIAEGTGPMHAYVEAAQRMFWPVVSSTATTLCAFLPMLFWPGVPGEFMALVPVALWGMFVGAMQLLNPGYLFAGATGMPAALLGAAIFLLSAVAASITLGAAELQRHQRGVIAGNRLRGFGWFIKMIVGNPVMPVVTLLVVGFGIMTVFGLFQTNNRGVEFFVESEPEQATAYVRARGNISLHEKDEMVRATENLIMQHPAVINVFSFAGEGGLNTDASGASTPPDTIGQPFSIIMTGTGIVALAGIVVNNNIVLIDTYQEFSQHMPRLEAIIRTAEARIRPVLLTTITTMAGLAPRMFGISLNFINGGYSIDSPTALWWKQLATAVVFGLGVATVLTLVVTPSLLAIRVWLSTYMAWMGRVIARISGGSSSQVVRDTELQRKARRLPSTEIDWLGEPAAKDTDDVSTSNDAAEDADTPTGSSPLRAAE
eukprot:g19969.t1